MSLGRTLFDALAPLNVDADGEENADLLAWCAAVCGPAEPIWDRLQETEDRPPWALLFDADECPAYALPWLSQFVGVRIEDQWSEEEIRAAIKNPSGWKRGTPEAIRLAARATLTGSKSVSIFERDGDAYNLTVRTLTSETPDEAATEAAILRQKPIGLLLDYQAIAGQTWADVVSNHADWDEVTDTYATWEQMVATPP